MKTGIIVSIILILMSGLMLPAFASDTAKSTGLPTSGQSRSDNLERDWLDTGSVRGKHPLILKRKSGFVYKCHECHKDFKTPLKAVNKPIGEHRNLRFDHGLNLNCLSCHHPESRGVYIDHDFSKIPESQPVLLCRKCHGPVYRDWEAGIHGRLNGYWDTVQGVQTKLDCNRCHDPHQPVFQQLVPMAPPALSRFKNRLKGTEHE